MAVAVALLPEVLRPAEPTKWIAGESPLKMEFKPRYDPNRAYMVDYGWGGNYIANGACLNEMERIMFEDFKKLIDESPRKVSRHEKQVRTARYNRRRRQ